MSTAAFSIENQIIEKMNRLDVTAAFVSGMAGFTQTKLSQGLSGLRPLSNQESLVLLKTVNRLEKLAQLAAPLPLAFKNPVVMRRLLADLEDGVLQITVVQSQ